MGSPAGKDLVFEFVNVKIGFDGWDCVTVDFRNGDGIDEVDFQASERGGKRDSISAIGLCLYINDEDLLELGKSVSQKGSSQRHVLHQLTPRVSFSTVSRRASEPDTFRGPA